MSTRSARARIAGLTTAAAAIATLSFVVAGVAGASPAGKQAIDFAYLQAQITKASALPRFQAPGPAFDASKAKGKKMFSIPVSMANPFTANIQTGMQGAAKVLGIKYTTFSNQGQPSQWVQGMGQAITQKVDFIDLQGGTDPRLLGPQLAAARKAHIPVQTSHLYDVSQPAPSSIDLSVPAEYQVAAKLEADWIILDTKGKSDVVVVTSNEILPTAPIVNAIKAEFAKQCGSACKLTFLNVPVTEWATKITPGVQSAMIKDPGVNYILPIYDSMSQFVVPAITAAGKNGKVFIATYNGTPFVMDYLNKGQAVKMEVGENLNWLGWAYIDSAARYMAGVALPKPPKHFNEHTALRVFTSKNIKEAIVGGKAALSTGYGNAYIAGYQKLWAGGPAATSFSASFKGQAQVKVTGSKADIKADATGNSSLTGDGSKLSGTGIGNTAATPCPVFTGDGQIAAANGDKINFTVDPKSSGCPVEGDNNAVNILGTAKVTGGTGKFAKVGGSLRFTGEFTRNDGALTMQWTGSLTGV